jgi:hypothetical protein
VLILRLLLMMVQDVEVAPSFQPLLGLAANFLRPHESQVADPMIEALTPIINHREDQVMLVNLGPADGRAQTSFETLGRALASEPERVAVIV